MQDSDGVAIWPHLLRDYAATSLSTESPAAALSAASLLGHRNFSTTEKYYIRANQLEASRKINAAVSSLYVSPGTGMSKFPASTRSGAMQPRGPRPHATGFPTRRK